MKKDNTSLLTGYLALLAAIFLGSPGTSCRISS